MVLSVAIMNYIQKSDAYNLLWKDVTRCPCWMTDPFATALKVLLEGLEGEDVEIYVKEGAAGKASAAAEAAEPATLFSGRRLGMTRDEIVALEKRDPDQTASTSETVLELDYIDQHSPYVYDPDILLRSYILVNDRVKTMTCLGKTDSLRTELKTILKAEYGEPAEVSPAGILKYLTELTGQYIQYSVERPLQWKIDQDTIVWDYITKEDAGSTEFVMVIGAEYELPPMKQDYPLMPEAPGTFQTKNGSLIIDASHADQGYIMAKADNPEIKWSVAISKDGYETIYTIGNSDEYAVFPLPFGSGDYTVSLLETKELPGDEFEFENEYKYEYVPAGSLTVTAKIEDDLSCFLYPNIYVDFTAESPWVLQASELCRNLTDQNEKFQAIKSFITNQFAYDFIKSVTVPKDAPPDIEMCWKNKMGICQDLSSLACAMLRSQGIPAAVVFGLFGSEYRALTLVKVNNDLVFYDPSADIAGVHTDIIKIICSPYALTVY